MTVDRIKESGVRDVAILHKKYINKGFLSILGLSFLNLVYQSMINSNTSVCIVAEEDSKIAGFIAGTVNVRDFYREFLVKQFFKAIVVLLPNVIKPEVAKKIYETMIYPIRIEENLPKAEILSIVVNDNFRGKGIGQILFAKLVEEFKKRYVNSFKVVVGSNLIAASRFYEKMGGIFHSEVEVHKNEKSKVYVWNI